MPTTDPNRARRLELILQQLETLPTLPAVAMRLLQVTGDESSDARQVVDLVRSDPALTAKILAMCRGSGGGLREPVTTIDRAVMFLGFGAIRNAVLSIKVFETFGSPPATPSKMPSGDAGDTDANAESGFDRAGFWRHSLAVAIAAEMIAAGHADLIRPLRPAEAFVCGLLHDVGKLALEHLLPKSYQRVVELTERHQLDIADAERKVIGLDHHTAGKRLAEHWQLPHMLQDTIWLHGSAHHTLPDLPHRALIDIVSTADLLVRQQHVGYSGNHRLSEGLEERSRRAGLDPDRVKRVVEGLCEELERRAAAMGLGQTPSRELFLESIMQANVVLGRLNTELESRRTLATGRGRVLDAIIQFHEASGKPGGGVQDVLKAATVTAASILGDGYYGMLYQPTAGQPWLFNQYSADGRLLRSEFIDPPDDAPELSRLRQGQSLSVQLIHQVPWITDRVLPSVDVRSVGLLALPCGWGTAAVMLHDREDLPDADQLDALLHTWGAAIAAATQHQGARRLGEQLVETGRALADAQENLLRSRSMARLGEMAAGAAHEMNNPLAVISGRAQLLAGRLEPDGRDRGDAQQIHQQADRLSDLITALRAFAEPPRPRFAETAAADIIDAAVQSLRRQAPDAPAPIIEEMEDAPPLRTDGEQAASALAELLANAAQADAERPICIRTSVDPINDRFLFQVIDQGVGMDAATLEHAFDPFFSAKPAGRRVGLGLANAQRLVEGLGGDIDLSSEIDRGTTATLSIPIGDAEPADENQETPYSPMGSDDRR